MVVIEWYTRMQAYTHMRMDASTHVQEHVRAERERERRQTENRL